MLRKDIAGVRSEIEKTANRSGLVGMSRNGIMQGSEYHGGGADAGDRREGVKVPIID